VAERGVKTTLPDISMIRIGKFPYRKTVKVIRGYSGGQRGHYSE
jgi:hypothetical protein